MPFYFDNFNYFSESGDILYSVYYGDANQYPNSYQFDGTIYFFEPPNPLDSLTEEQRQDYNQRCQDKKCLPKDLVEELGPTPLYTPKFPEEPARTDRIKWNIWW